MFKLAEKIQRIEISSLWGGHKHIVWELRPEVNVLSGRNVEGKSTILNRLIQHLRSIPSSGEIVGGQQLGVKIDFTPSDATCIHYDIIRSFDRPIVPTGDLPAIVETMPGVHTELDWQLYLVQRANGPRRLRCSRRVSST